MVAFSTCWWAFRLLFGVTVVLFFWRGLLEGRRRESVLFSCVLTQQACAAWGKAGLNCCMILLYSPCAHADAWPPPPPIVHLISTLSSAPPLLSSVQQQLSPSSTPGKEAPSLTLTHSINMQNVSSRLPLVGDLHLRHKLRVRGWVSSIHLCFWESCEHVDTGSVASVAILCQH